MAAPQDTSLMPGFAMKDGMTIRITALDPATGIEDTSVVVSDVRLSVLPESKLPDAPQVFDPVLVRTQPGA